MQKTIITVLAASLALSGCATSSSNIAASYTSPMQYQSYDCAQLTNEAQRVQGRVNQLAGRLDEAASNDKALAGVGIILFWPALFALGGTKQQEADYARLKGEYDAISQAMIVKKCDQGNLAAIDTPAANGTPSANKTNAAPQPQQQLPEVTAQPPEQPSSPTPTDNMAPSTP